MKQGFSTLAHLVNEVTRINRSKRDFALNSRNAKVVVVENQPMIKVAFRGDDPLDADGEMFEILPICHEQLMGPDMCGIPMSYGKRLIKDAPDLYATNVNHWLMSTPKDRMLRTVDSQARAMVSTSYRRLDNFDLLAHLLPVINEVGQRELVRIGDCSALSEDVDDYPDWIVASCNLDQERMDIKLVFPRMSAALHKDRKISQHNPPGWLGGIRKGHDVTTGYAFPMLTISNSEVGRGRVKILPGILDGGCTNGLVLEKYSTMTNHVGRRHKLDDEMDYAEEMISDDTRRMEDLAYWNRCADVIRGTLTEATFEAIVGQMNAAYELPIEGDKVKATQVLANNYSLATSEQEAILKALVDGKDYTLGGLIDAVTWVANDVDDYRRATELETLGGTLMTLSTREWRAIATAH